MWTLFWDMNSGGSTLDSEDILVIRTDEVSEEDKKGDLPTQGYIWV